MAIIIQKLWGLLFIGGVLYLLMLASTDSPMGDLAFPGIVVALSAWGWMQAGDKRKGG